MINDSFRSKKIVLFYQAGSVSVLDAALISESKKVGSIVAYNRVLENRELTFKKEMGIFRDVNTGSFWDITGHCYQGELIGNQLQIEKHSNHFAFAWLAFYPNSEIFTN